MSGTKKLIAFTLYHGVSPLDLVGPLTVLRNLAGTRYRTVVVGGNCRPFASGANVPYVTPFRRKRSPPREKNRPSTTNGDEIAGGTPVTG